MGKNGKRASKRSQAKSKKSEAEGELKLRDFLPADINSVVTAFDQLMSNELWWRDTGLPGNHVSVFGSVIDLEIIDRLQDMGVLPRLTRALLVELVEKKVIQKGKMLFDTRTTVLFTGEQTSADRLAYELAVDPIRWNAFFSTHVRTSKKLAAQPQRVVLTSGPKREARPTPAEVNDTISRLTDSGRQVIKCLGEHKVLSIHSPNLPTQSTISKWVGKEWNGNFKSTLSMLVKLKCLENGTDHGLRGGYFLTKLGVTVARALSRPKRPPGGPV